MRIRLTMPQSLYMPSAAHRLQAALRAPTFCVQRREPARPQPVLDHGLVSDVERGPLSDCGCVAPELHTYYRWTWAAPVSNADDGPDLVVIMLNPSCPDDAVASPTFRAITAWAQQSSARSLTAVNLISRRADSPTLNRMSAADLIGPDRSSIAKNRDVIKRALGQADAAILAFGNVATRPMSRDAKELLLTEVAWLTKHLKIAEVPTAQFLHGPMHPSRWAYIVNTNPAVKQHFAQSGFAGLLRAP
jgi:hypothetical protein